MDDRGILSADFIFATLLIVIVIGSLVTIIADRMNTASQTEELGKSRMTAESVAEAINKVYSGGTGHSATINLPSNIADKNYDIKVNSTGVYILIDGMIGKAYIVPKGISNSYSLSNSNVIMQNGHNYYIKNVNDSSRHNWVVITET
jgi:uncharacterized membrane protein YraQ (UPF0718 family)